MMFKAVKIVCSVLAASALLCSAYPCFADDSACQEQAKECLTRSGADRESCLNRITCSDATLGALLGKRVQFAASSSQDAIEGPAFLGPQIVDRRCVANFDSALSAALIRGRISAETIEALNVSLDQCSRSYAPDITRP